MHPLVDLAKKAIEQYVCNGSPPDAAEFGGLEGLEGEKAGVFVCIKKHGELRGCIGTILPQTDSIPAEVVNNAIGAATHDPRFIPVCSEELNDLSYSVDVLTQPEEVEGMDYLDPKRYGVIVTKGPRRGLLLPDLEGVDTVEEQLRIAKLKAGIAPDDRDVQIQRFEVKRYA